MAGSLILQIAMREVTQLMPSDRLTLADFRSDARFAKARVVLPSTGELSRGDRCAQESSG
jgi:hypothetical protein